MKTWIKRILKSFLKSYREDLKAEIIAEITEKLGDGRIVPLGGGRNPPPKNES